MVPHAVASKNGYPSQEAFSTHRLVAQAAGDVRSGGEAPSTSEQAPRTSPRSALTTSVKFLPDEVTIVIAGDTSLGSTRYSRTTVRPATGRGQ